MKAPRTPNPNFLEFLQRVASGDLDRVSHHLRAEPDLAATASPVGATRQSAADYFFPSISLYLYVGDTPLHLAAGAFSRPLVDLLLHYGANCRARNRLGAEPLHYASGRDRGLPDEQSDVIASLIARGADPNARDKPGVAPLHRAVRSRSLAAVRALLDGGAELRATNQSGSTPLHLAVQDTGASGSGSPEARRQQTEIIRLLLARGAKPTDPDSRGRTVQTVAKSRWIQRLLEDPATGAPSKS